MAWTRAWDPRIFQWANLEPEPGKFRWEALDRYLDKCRKENLNVLAVIGYPPRWASDWSMAEMARIRATDPANRDNFRIEEPERYKPRNLDEWATFLRKLVEHCTPQVQYYEIYNEVDYMAAELFCFFQRNNSGLRQAVARFLPDHQGSQSQGESSYQRVQPRTSRQPQHRPGNPPARRR